MEKIYDIIVIGAGPAGITAGIYAVRKNMKCLILSENIGGQTAWSGDVENYTGYQFISGPDLAEKFNDHIKEYGITVKEPESVKEVSENKGIFLIRTDKAEYPTRTVLIASGKKSRELGVSGEKEFKNKGVAYCATCDGPVFRGKDVAVVGGGNSALDAALQLIEICNKVYIVNNTDKLGGDAVMRDKVITADNVTVFNDSEVSEISGDIFVEGIKIKKKDKEIAVPLQGVFVEIGLSPNSGFTDMVEKNPAGEIVVNSYNETSVPGVFAAGDVTDVPEKQIIIAAGEGAKAVLSAFKYLAKKKS